MSLITDKNTKAFDLALIHRGDCIRVKRAGDMLHRNGFVTKLSDQTIEILYCNVQNAATSYLQISAVDVAAGIWEIWWTSDFKTINVEPGGGANA